jgi:N-acylneuraminate cytidylyltransferase
MTIPILAVIPARGGSKGLPGKNVRPLAGLPLIAHSIRCAAMSKEITRTVVSTDSDEIATVARTHGGDVPFRRPPELASDTAALMPVLEHALHESERQDGRRYEALLLLDPTSPGRLPGDIARATEILCADESIDGVVACSVPTFNPFFVGVTERDGWLERAFPEATFTRRQDAPRFLRINGALYLWRRRVIEAAPTTHWLDGKLRLLEIPEARALSIDDLHEFQMASLLVEQRIVAFPWLDGPAKEGP